MPAPDIEGLPIVFESTVARQRDGATVSPVAWGQARSIGDDVVMMAAGPGGVKWGGVSGGVER
jgi:hypothetical protein